MNLPVHGLSGDIREANTYYEDPHKVLGRFDFVMANSAGDARGSELEIRKKVILSGAVDVDELVGPMIQLKRRLELKNSNLRTTRDLLLPKLISGELDVSALPEPAHTKVPGWD